MEIGSVRQVDIEQEVQQSYLDYAMSVIVSRALPDVRDGLKPVQRRVLYAMHDMGLRSDKAYKKCARIVGEVLGKYHPHSEAPVYEALVRMAQDFSMRYMLVDGQGNFGSSDGDSAAAMRYTEARLHTVADPLLADIEKDTVDFGPNFDGTLTEPLVLPAGVPNLLVNGSSGIAVGMATNIPPHNLGEVCDALEYMIEQGDRAEDVSVEDLMRFIQGPDFPTGGVLYRYAQGQAEADRVDALENAYAVGRGRFTVQAKAHIEEMSRNRHRIVVTELPYQVNKARLAERIAELARDGRVEGIADLRDESDRQGMRLVVELTRTADPRDVLAQLFKLTPMQSTFGLIMLALVGGEPRLLSLKRVLQHFLEHRRDIVIRRSRFELDRAKARGHVLEGLLIALENLDEVIRLIRRAESAEVARTGLMKKFKLTEIQAQAILDLQLRRLAALERRKIEEEYAEVKAQVVRLEALLASPRKIMGVVRGELRALKARYGDARRTQIIAGGEVSLTARELVHEADVVVALSVNGHLRVVDQSDAKTLAVAADGETPRLLAWGNMRDDLCACDTRGNAVILGMHRLPFDERSAWVPAADAVGLAAESRVAGLVCLHRPDQDEGDGWAGYLTIVTRGGKVKRVAARELAAVRGSGLIIGIDANDEAVSVLRSEGQQHLLLLTAAGKAIRFAEEEVRAMGLAAAGVLGIRLSEGDQVVSACVLDAEMSLVSVTANGYAKRVVAGEFPTQGRYGQGVTAFPVSSRTGPVVGLAVGEAAGLVVFGTGKGRTIALNLVDIPRGRRDVQGRMLPGLRGGEIVVSLVFLPTGPGEPSTEAIPVELRHKSSGTPSVRAGGQTVGKKERTRRVASGPVASPKAGTQKTGKGSSVPSRAAPREKKPVGRDDARKQTTGKREKASGESGKPRGKRPQAGPTKGASAAEAPIKGLKRPSTGRSKKSRSRAAPRSVNPRGQGR